MYIYIYIYTYMYIYILYTYIYIYTHIKDNSRNVFEKYVFSLTNLRMYSASIKTNNGNTFLNLIEMHFPKTNKLQKIFNKSTVKINYSYMTNISAIILGHNKNLLNPIVTKYGCNC